MPIIAPGAGYDTEESEGVPHTPMTAEQAQALRQRDPSVSAWQVVRWQVLTGGLVADLHLPGPVERARFLGLELEPGALDGAEGLIAGCGRLEAQERQAA